MSHELTAKNRTHVAEYFQKLLHPPPDFEPVTTQRANRAARSSRLFPILIATRTNPAWRAKLLIAGTHAGVLQALYA